jgi:hypothetical protein
VQLHADKQCCLIITVSPANSFLELSQGCNIMTFSSSSIRMLTPQFHGILRRKRLHAKQLFIDFDSV